MSGKSVVDVFSQGGVIVYPTEAVFGIGCDPDNDAALERLIDIKQRDKNKGLILLASSYEQLLPYVDDSQLTSEQRSLLLSRWPDGITQVMPKNNCISPLLSGTFDTIAVRVTSQPDVVALCNQVNKPIVSTSANLSGIEPVKRWQDLDPKLTTQVDFIVKGETLDFAKPSLIIDALTGETFRS